jgi:hypothetical protein
MQTMPLSELNEREKNERLSTIELKKILVALDNLDTCVQEEFEDKVFRDSYHDLSTNLLLVITDMRNLIYDKFNGQ